MTAQFAPRVRRTAQNTQYTYNLGRRVYDVKTYPVLSPQGATILIHGHENGLTLVWRGGRRLKAPKEPAAEQQRNGGNSGADDAVMIIDSDDDAPPPAAAAPKPFVDKPEFEDVRSDDQGYESTDLEVVQTLDLSLGTAVRHIAVLPMPHCSAQDAAWGGVELFKHKMVFAVTCLTAEVYVVSLPLTPPSHESKARPELKADLLGGSAGRGLWGETLVALGGQVQHSDGLAITLSKLQQAKPSTSTRSSRSADPGSNSQAARLVVAAHSRQATGVLRLWEVTLGTQKPGASDRPLEPFQTDFLPSPLTCISFNPTHKTQLLAVASPHAVRVYDYSLPSLPPDDSDGPLPPQGSWLLSLYPPFIRGAGLSTARKPVIAAGWIVHGRAVLALLADGLWGIWDIDGAGPTLSGASSSNGLFSKVTSAVRGAALTTFSTSGYLDGFSPLRTPGSQRASGDLNPMTPHTRRDVVTNSLSGGPERLAAIRGGIEVIQLPLEPGRSSHSSGSDDESVVLWLGGVDYAVAVIPVLGRFWDAQIRRSSGGGSNIFSGAQPTRMIRLSELNAGLLGERCGGVGAIPRAPSSSSHDGGLPIEVLVRGDSRLVIVREADDAVPSSSFNSKLAGARKRLLGPVSSQETAQPAAIVVHSRPGTSAKVNHAAFAQSLRGQKGGSVRGRMSLFGKPRPDSDEEGGAGTQQSPRKVPSATDLFFDDGPRFTQSMLAIRQQDQEVDHGFPSFERDLMDAADKSDDEEAALGRNVDEEILDLQGLEHSMNMMEDVYHLGSQNVFFENA